MSQNNTKPDAEVRTLLPNNNAFSDILKEEMDSSALQGTFKTNLESKTTRFHSYNLQFKLRQSIMEALFQIQSHDITKTQQVTSAASQVV